MTSEISSSADRRDTAIRDAFVARFKQELKHVPGLALTVEQAARLFDLPKDVCGRLIASLVEGGEIHVRPDGRFIRR